MRRAILVGHVAADRGLRDAVRSLQIGGCDPRTLGDEPLRDRSANPARGTGHEDPQRFEAAHQKGKTSLIAATAASLSPPAGMTSKVSCRS